MRGAEIAGFGPERISRYHSGKLLRGSSARVVNMVSAGVDMADVVVGWMGGWMDESVKILITTVDATFDAVIFVHTLLYECCD